MPDVVPTPPAPSRTVRPAVRPELTPAMFSPSFKFKMIRAYPVISGMDRTFLEWHATPDEKDDAFGRILASQNLRRTCEMDYERRIARGQERAR